VESLEHTPTTAPLLRTLEDVVRWTLATGASIVEVVHQDEYTLDVILQATPGGPAVVLDCT